jgi:hypothetical protein
MQSYAVEVVSADLKQPGCDDTLDFLHGQLWVRVFDGSSQEKMAPVKGSVFPPAVLETVKVSPRSFSLKNGKFLC